MKNPTAERVRALLDYDPTSGIFTWRWRPIYDFKTRQAWQHWNNHFRGKRAGSLCVADGYRYLRVDGARLGEHRVAWLYCYGIMPDEIDHENGRKPENWIDNLRSVTTIENARNQPIRKNNKSGVTGVCWDKASEKWQAYIYVQGRMIRLGYFKNLQDARQSRKAAEAKYEFHPNHGRAAS